MKSEKLCLFRELITVVPLSGKQPEKEWLNSLTPTKEKVLYQQRNLNIIRKDYESLLEKHKADAFRLQKMAKQIAQAQRDLERLQYTQWK